MKKRRLKGWVKNLFGYTLIIIIGVFCIFALCERAEQIDRSISYEESY